MVIAQVARIACSAVILLVLRMEWQTKESPMLRKQGLTLDTKASYAIRIQGYLDDSWSDRMNGVSITLQSRPSEAPVTVLAGEFQDQAALAGVLNTLYDLGLPLLSVECLAIEPMNSRS